VGLPPRRSTWLWPFGIVPVSKLSKLRKHRVDWVELMVRATNKAAVRFYRRFGPAHARLVWRYYEDGGDALRIGIHVNRTENAL